MTKCVLKIATLAFVFGLSSRGYGFPEHNHGWWLEKPLTENHELVLAEGVKLTVQTGLGALSITAGAGYKRTYSWDDSSCSRSVVHWPRNERWYGSYGIYYPGPGDHWKECGGITRGVLEEGQMHFASAENALKWINYEKSMCRSAAGASCHVTYSKDGLLVMFGKTLSRRQLDVKVFQIYVEGKKPADLPGADAEPQLTTALLELF